MTDLDITSCDLISGAFWISQILYAKKYLRGCTVVQYVSILKSNENKIHCIKLYSNYFNFLVILQN